jgi:hypothetical protein
MQKKGFKIDLGKIDAIETSINDLAMQMPQLEAKLNEVQNKIKSNMDSLNNMIPEFELMDKLSKQIGDTPLMDRITKGKKMLQEKLAVCTKLYSRIK